MKEAYVSFEVAKLLKEKGFSIPSDTSYEDFLWQMYDKNGKVHWVVYNGDWCFRITQQMACRWLREEHNIFVTVQPCEIGAGVDDYTYVIYEIQPEDYHFKFIAQGRIQPIAYTMDYEGTLEEGIKQVLTNLI